MLPSFFKRTANSGAPLWSRWLNGAIKGIICVLFIWALYVQVFQREDLPALWDTFLRAFQFPDLLWLLLVILLVPVNWGVETLKWNVLIRSFIQLPFWQVYQAILAGVTVSMATPNRIGEYGGRILLVPAKHNWQAIVATLVGSYCQLLVLLCMGFLGLAVFSTQFLDQPFPSWNWIVVSGILTVFLLILVLMNIRWIGKFVARYVQHPRIRRVIKPLGVLRNYSSGVLLKALGLAFCRYCIYLLQYTLLLYFFDLEIPVLGAISGIATIFLLQTSVPLPPLIGLLARGQVALFIWGQFSSESLQILATSFGLFIINLALPALLGAVFIVQTNVMKSLGYDVE